MDTDLKKKDIKVEEDVFGNDKGINGNKRGNSYDQGTFYTFKQMSIQIYTYICAKTSQ